MNERIKELLVEADIKFDRDINEIEVCVMLPSDLEKFAELIVRECIWEVVKDNEVPHNIQVLIGERFKQHFGVEE